ncbi:hypothetical protein LOK49_LG04G02005 [Camellia lanceoleosa]|uniref:Uncharacterized protein n=1 Tax=Camellia lanceoleosa TaxID=1840588 RepID=A0ACC0I2G2_9ERIC|nr:hypothetical protein LOK49_LG04G02005 [Camellia lanceoleosa]
MHEYRLPNNNPKAPTVGNDMRAGPEDIYLSTSLASYLDNMLTKVQRKLNFRKEKEKLDGAFGEWKDYTSKSARWQGERVDTRRFNYL